MSQCQWIVSNRRSRSNKVSVVTGPEEKVTGEWVKNTQKQLFRPDKTTKHASSTDCAEKTGFCVLHRVKSTKNEEKQKENNAELENAQSSNANTQRIYPLHRLLQVRDSGSFGDIPHVRQRHKKRQRAMRNNSNKQQGQQELQRMKVCDEQQDAQQWSCQPSILEPGKLGMRGAGLRGNQTLRGIASIIAGSP